jgi:tetratricopeptide (TPR) repeat protein
MIPLVAALALLAQDPSFAPHVELENLEGRSWYSVHARNASAARVLLEIARASGRELEGEISLGSAFLTLDLVRRPLDQVLEYALGSIGLRHELRQDAIVILTDAPGDPHADLALAWEAWDRAAARHPESPEAPAARLSQGELSELSGDVQKARQEYLSLPQDFPRAKEVGEALLRAGRICERLGDWDQAGQIFRKLAGRDAEPELQASARLEWARTMIAQGESRTALQLISSLDASYPARSLLETTARTLVRARALEASGAHMEALHELDATDPELDPLGRGEALEIRARALAGAGQKAEASRAWLLYAQKASAAERSYAYRQAAELALDSGDELCVLFAAREAAARGVDVDLGDLEQRASQALGLAPSAAQDLSARISDAERALRLGALESATPAFESLFQARGALEEETAARVTIGWASCVAARDGVDAAVALILKERKRVPSKSAHRILDAGAADLFEQAGRLDEALDAYEGRYRR